MKRAQLFEFNDLEWVGPDLRDSIVESLSRTLRWGGVLRELVAPFRAFLDEAGTHEVLDLCCGAGGPAEILAAEFRRSGDRSPRFILTDLFPRVLAWERARAADPESIDFFPEPVDATRIPDSLGRGRARVVINAFHHFPPEIARSILADAARSGASIFISEPFDRNPLRFVPWAPMGIAAAMANPVLTPEPRLGKFLITWFSPVMLSVSAWDGFVSTLRIYTEADLREMVAPFGERYRWEFGRYRYFPLGRGYYFYGVPDGVAR
ncbi:MAG: class I SAM-dependent methyltransferase [Deltaproteobacteria bacterium]|nr:class I SAM-dependent methyltransferase [Deltaproteobacteria bacterium]